MKPLRFWFGVVVGGLFATSSATIIGQLRSHPEQKPIEYRRVCRSTGPDILVYAPLNPGDVGISSTDCELDTYGFWSNRLRWNCKQQKCEVEKR